VADIKQKLQLSSITAENGTKVLGARCEWGQRYGYRRRWGAITMPREDRY